MTGSVRRLRRASGVGALGVLGVTALLGAGGSGHRRAEGVLAARSSSGRPAPLLVPLASSFSTPDGTWVDVPMGRVGQLVNTFWQTFVLRPSSSRWTLVTPPGVADNGGLVSTSSSNGRVLAGFEASQLLGYSPLAETADAGRSWSAGLVPARLAATPDALALSSQGGMLALLGSDGGSVLSSTGNPSVWHTLVRATALRRSPAGRNCGLLRLGAVAFAPDGSPLVGATCDGGGRAGVFARVGASWVLEPLRLPGGRSSVGETLRLSSSGGPTSALVELDGVRRVALVGAWPLAAGSWSASRPLALPARTRLVASGTLGSGAVFVLLATVSSLRLETTGLPRAGAAWQELPAPPPGTAAAAFSGAAGATRVDAFVAHGSTLTDDVLDLRSRRWVRSQTIEVPITYGSSG